MPPTRSTRLPFEILVVDDETDVRELLAEYFRERGQEVAVASDGRAAVAAIERSPARFGLIFADLQLPGLDGLHILKAAKTANPSAYVVIITGYASLDSAIQAVRLGAYDYLTKPFSLGQIEVLVQRVLDRITLEAENRHLSRQIGERDPSPAAVSIAQRLDAIDARLARLEELLTHRFSRP